MRHAAGVVLLLVIGVAAGCRSDVLFVASYDMNDTLTRGTVESLQTALDAASEEKVSVEICEIGANVHKAPGTLAEYAEWARLKVINTAAKVVVCCDDIAIREVAQRLATTEALFVLCGMTGPPGDYGLAESTNVYGVMDRGTAADAVELIRRVNPSARRLGLLGDNSPMTASVASEIGALSGAPLRLVGVEIAQTREGWMAALGRLQEKADAILVAGMSRITDEEGRPVSERNLAVETGLASKALTVGLWRHTVMEGGLLLACAPSAGERGRAVAKYVLWCLQEEPTGAAPRRFTTPKGSFYVNLALAERHGIVIPKDVVDAAVGVVRPAAAPAGPPRE